jgi:hypothetical protein
MLAARTVLAQMPTMYFGTVPFVASKLVVRIELIDPDHDPVARGLGDN